MFLIFKNDRPAGNKRYNTYEAARQAIRKRLRQLTADRYKGQPRLPMWSLGYEIRQV